MKSDVIARDYPVLHKFIGQVEFGFLYFGRRIFRRGNVLALHDQTRVVENRVIGLLCQVLVRVRVVVFGLRLLVVVDEGLSGPCVAGQVLGPLDSLGVRAAFAGLEFGSCVRVAFVVDGLQVVVELSNEEGRAAVGALHLDRHVDHLLADLQQLLLLRTGRFVALQLSGQVFY